MTEPHDPVDAPDDASPPDSSRDPMAALLKRSLAEPPRSSTSILRGVQRRIRKRSRGRFFADGWSTGDGRVSPLLIAAAMLVVLIVAYFALGPVVVQ